MKYFFIINPTAGKNDPALLLAPKINTAFVHRGESFVIYTTRARRDAIAYVRRQCLAYPEEALRFYACGGDGTLGEVANGIFGFANASLGLIPCGSGNDFAKNFPGLDFWDINAQLAGDVVPIDLIQFNDMLSINLCNCGLDADICHNMPLFKHVPGVSGPSAYQLSILYTFLKKLGKHASITLDGGDPMELDILMMVIANGQFYGGSYRGAPLARVDDGLLDVCIVPKLGRPAILGLMKKYQQGLHTSDEVLKKLITYRRAREVHIDFGQPITMCVDGETFQNDSLTARVLPRAISLALPAAAVAAPPPATPCCAAAGK